jgi:hypothetical protein
VRTTSTGLSTFPSGQAPIPSMSSARDTDRNRPLPRRLLSLPDATRGGSCPRGRGHRVLSRAPGRLGPGGGRVAGGGVRLCPDDSAPDTAEISRAVHVYLTDPILGSRVIVRRCNADTTAARLSIPERRERKGMSALRPGDDVVALAAVLFVRLAVRSLHLQRALRRAAQDRASRT